MSGAAGGTRIPRSAVEQTVKDYTDNILSKIEGFKDKVEEMWNNKGRVHKIPLRQLQEWIDEYKIKVKDLLLAKLNE